MTDILFFTGPTATSYRTNSITHIAKVLVNVDSLLVTLFRITDCTFSHSNRHKLSLFDWCMNSVSKPCLRIMSF